ncbi:hydroxymethylglutaryl-CoA lyase [Ottowia thiooxydans]|uniref:hydroxymethylglutaryl-CoA lyase n=1 Tax=Ottowia thiooxydans TaxID=219182 RepID=UPI00040E9B1A|nr:hydroxymethylglutaryl-CoA lyase [Ottowia thiooxydans]
MADYPNSVRINEDGPREGFQIERADIPSQDKIELIDALSQTGLKSIQVASFVHPKRVPSMADAEAVVAGISMRADVEYTALFMNERGLERALATGRLSPRASFGLSASPAFLARNANASVEKQKESKRAMVRLMQERGIAPANVGNISAAFGCNFQGDIGIPALLDTARDVFELAQEFDVKIESLGLSDTMAWATPNKIRHALHALRETYPDVDISLHLHNTRGMAVANALAGLEMGVTEFDTSIGGLGGCPFAAHKGASGNLCTEDFAFMCEEMGISTGLDLDALIDAARLAERIVGHPLPGSVMRGGSLSRMRVLNQVSV